MTGLFAKAVRRYADKTGESLEQIVYVTITDLSRRVIQRTPVGNPSLWLHNSGSKESPSYVNFLSHRNAPAGYTGGQAKGNWFASIGSPSKEIDRSIRAKNASAPINRDAAIRRAAAGNIYYLSNNLPYIRALEFGWSTQAPAGMARVTVSEFQQILQKATKRSFK
jgi:hypothetical protein